MANNLALDSLMMEASAAAYHIVRNSDGTLTLTGSDPAGVAYAVDANGVITNTGLAGFTIERVFINDETGFKAITLVGPNNERIITFAGTEDIQDAVADVQLGWNQWKGEIRPGVPSNGPSGQSVLNYIRETLANDPTATFNFAGHSLGGGLAEYAAYFAKTELESELRKTVPGFISLNLTLTTFNAFGILDSIAEHISDTASQLAASTLMQGVYVAHYMEKGDLVSRLGGGHVGDNVGFGLGSPNVYELGSNPLAFYWDAHVLPTIYTQDLSSATALYNPNYLNLKESQKIGAAIVRMGNPTLTGPQAVIDLVKAIDAALPQANAQEIDNLMQRALANLHDAGKLNNAYYDQFSQIEWSKEFRTGLLGAADDTVLALVTGKLFTATDKTLDALTMLKDWFGATASTAIDAVADDVVNYRQTVETYIIPSNLGALPADEFLLWLSEGYDIPSVMQVAESTATLAINNPGALEAQIEANPLSFLPPLTAPDRADYSSDAAGDTAYQQALTLYTQKQDERTQVQDLYNQYQTYLQNLPLPTLGSLGPLGTVLTGDADPNYPNDQLWAGSDTQTITGGLGNDVLLGASGSAGMVQDIQLHGGVGDDVLDANFEQTLWYYNLSAGQVDGQWVGGQDYFIAHYGAPHPGPGAKLYGEDGVDVLYGSLRDDTLDGGAGTDTLYGFLGDDDVNGGINNDWLDGGEGADRLDGGDGQDLLFGSAGTDELIGGADDDYLYGDADTSWSKVAYWDGTTVTLNTDSNIPLAPRGRWDAPLRPTYLGVLQDAPEALAGDDVLEGGAGDDHLYGGAGDDLLDGGTEADELQGEGGNDILFGSDGDDQLWGDVAPGTASADQADYLVTPDLTYYWRERHVGMDGNDYLDGGAGNDQLWGGGGRDHLVGGIGSDYLYGGLYNGSASGDDILEGGDQNDYLFGEDGNDTLRGDAGMDELLGGDGNDGLFGGTENDHLWGDAGNDVLHGEAGDDYLDGGEGEDTLFGGAGTDTLIGGAGRDVIYAGNDNDIIVGDGEDDLIFGEGGNDVIDGGAGNDELYGGAGINTLIGGLGNDILIGGPGDDIIEGGAGDDTVDGGGGNDTFRLSLGNDRYLNDGGDNLYTLALDTDTPNGFAIALQDTGGVDRLSFQPVYLGESPITGPLYLRPTLTGMTREGDDLLLNVRLSSDVQPYTEPTGSVRLINQYTSGHLETIDGLILKDTVQVSAETALQVAGTYVQTVGTDPNYIVHYPGIASYSGIEDILSVGTGNDDNLSSIFTSTTAPNSFYGYGGNDTLTGNAGDNVLNGLEGDDTVEGGRGHSMHFCDDIPLKRAA